MQSFRKGSALLPLAALVAGLATGTQPSSAQGLFDMLFGGQPRHGTRLQGEFPPPPTQKKPVAGSQDFEPYL